MLAAGYVQTAEKSKLKIERITKHKTTIDDISIDNITELKNISIKNGDTIFIPKTITEKENVVRIDGNVYRPESINQHNI